jgi:hypothetical protein
VKKPMADRIKVGTILIEEGTLLPESLRFVDSEPYAKGWRLVKNLEACGLDGKLREAGWTFFFMAGEVKATALGPGLGMTTRRAVRKVIASMKSDRLNCLEITQVVVKRFLGLRHVSVSAHRRQIQESMFLFRAELVAESNRARLASA